MKLLRTLIPSLLLVGAQVAQAASSWSFDEAVISVSSKGAGGAQLKDKYVKLRWDLIPIQISLTDTI
jgi:oligosaccharyltransferase complex subunit delta (ribophorin II)